MIISRKRLWIVALVIAALFVTATLGSYSYAKSMAADSCKLKSASMILNGKSYKMNSKSYKLPTNTSSVNITSFTGKITGSDCGDHYGNGQAEHNLVIYYSYTDTTNKSKWKKLSDTSHHFSELKDMTTMSGIKTKINMKNKQNLYVKIYLLGKESKKFKQGGVTINVKSVEEKNIHFTKTPKKQKIKKVKSQNNDSAKITWTKNKYAKGYQVYMSTKKNKGFKKVATVKSYKTTSKVIKNLKNNKKYYFKVRSYKQGANKVYGPFSAVKSVKI